MTNSGVPQLRQYVEEIFQDAPRSKQAVELKEEILQNLLDKYSDLRDEGKSEEAAYNIAVASIGDVHELLSTLDGGSAAPYSRQELEADRKRSAIFVSVAIMLYILSVIPNIIHPGTAAVTLMFVMIAVATGLLIYNAHTRLSYRKQDETVVEEFKAWQHQDGQEQRTFKTIKSVIWSVTVLLYLVISFTTMAWHITWIIFIIAVAVEKIMSALLELRH